MGPTPMPASKARETFGVPRGDVDIAPAGGNVAENIGANAYIGMLSGENPPVKRADDKSDVFPLDLASAPIFMYDFLDGFFPLIPLFAPFFPRRAF